MKVLTSIGATAFLTLALLTGCGGSSKTLVVSDSSATAGLPTPATAGPINTYTGTQTPGEWSFTIDNTNNVYSYQPVTYSAAATTGTITTVNGFKVLSTGGYALEVEGRAAVLRPGDSTTAPIFGVPQTECYSITGRLRFQYLGAVPLDPGNYGSIGASTDTTGASWAFDDLEGNEVAGPVSFSATCSTSSSLSTINFTGTETLLDDVLSLNGASGLGETAPVTNTKSNIWIGPTGFFVADQSVSSGTVINGTTVNTNTGSSVVGVAEPSSALTTSNIASTSHSYLGFIYEPGDTVWSTPTITFPVSFTGLSGEAFTNNDVTQALDSTTSMSVSLGTQDSTYHGRYLSASITVLDPAQNCATAIGNGLVSDVTVGINSDGYVTCTFPATAIVGNPESKYTIFVTAVNWATYEQAHGGAYKMQLYLFQQ